MKKGSVTFLVIGFILSSVLSSCGNQDGSLEIQSAWGRPAGAGENSAIYFQIQNQGRGDVLLGVNANIAEETSVHRTVINEDGTASMKPQISLEIPGGGVVTFEPGGLHVMLVNLNRALVEGDIINITLVFERAGELTIDVPVIGS